MVRVSRRVGKRPEDSSLTGTSEKGNFPPATRVDLLSDESARNPRLCRVQKGMREHTLPRRQTQTRLLHRHRHRTGRDVRAYSRRQKYQIGHAKQASLFRAPPILNSAARIHGLCPFTPERFHVLLNSLFKVLFNFPSRYLSAIGLVVVFSLRWSLPPA